MAMADGTGYLINLIYYASADTLKMVVQIPVPCLMALTSLLGRILSCSMKMVSKLRLVRGYFLVSCLKLIRLILLYVVDVVNRNKGVDYKIVLVFKSVGSV